MLRKYSNDMELIFNWFMSLTKEQLRNIGLYSKENSRGNISIRTLDDQYDDYYVIMSMTLNPELPRYWMMTEDTI